MLAANTTVVAVVAPASFPGLAAVRGANVRVLHPDPEADPLTRAVAATTEARRTAVPYLLHDADPTAAVATAWAARFDGSGTAGDLEVAVAATLARWRARSLDLPDYYVVVDPEALGITLRHWYFGVLGSAAPTRVVAASAGGSLEAELPTLATGPWWPGLDRLLDGVDAVVPDQVGPLSPTAGPAEGSGLVRLRP